MLRIAERLVVELPESHGPCQNIADLQLIIDIVADEAVALGLSDCNLHKRHLRSRLVRCGGNRVGPGDQALANLEIKYNVLPRIEEGQFFAVGALESNGLGRLTGGRDLCDHKLDRAGMPLSGNIPDGIHIRQRGRRGVKRFQARLSHAGGSADISKEILDFHRSASFLAAISSSIFFAALRPFVTAGPMPSPEMAWAPANSSPSMNRSASAVWSLATMWSSMVCE